VFAQSLQFYGRASWQRYVDGREAPVSTGGGSDGAPTLISVTPPRKHESAENGLLAENYPQLNRQFYDTAPWIYFQQRLLNLALVASAEKRHRKVFSDGIKLGPLTLKTKAPEAGDQSLPTPEQTYQAIEAEVLLHHSAETLLRFVHAHAEPDPCPWLRMSRLTSAGPFKNWVSTTLVKGSRVEQTVLCERLFGHDGNAARLEDFRRYVVLLAEHFLDPSSYNAAKHGMALQGASQQWSVEVDDLQLLNHAGASVSWLTRAPDPERQGLRWMEATRVFSVEATAALIHITTMLMESLWIQARQKHLDEPVSEFYCPPSPDDLFSVFDVRHWVMAEIGKPLRYEGVGSTMTITSRHFGLNRAPKR
jgi:hypothetical protein